jgi:glycosyltransferase involved in cell wall biosynthesis
VSEGLVVSYSSLLGGAERLLLDLVPALPGRPLLACPPGPLADGARSAGLEVHELAPRRMELRGGPREAAGAVGRIAAQARELRALRRRRPPWAVAWNMRTAMSAALAGFGGSGRGGGAVPLLFQHNDLLPSGPPAVPVRAAARRATRVIALSHAIARDLDPHGRLGERMTVSHAGVDLERFGLEPLPGGAPEVLVLGALVPWKRPELALEVAARVPEIRLLVAGAPLGVAGHELLDRMRERAARPDLAGRVELLGGLDDPRPALRRASLVLHCAPREPFGIALVEALATGRPVVAPGAEGPAEIVDQSCGRLYPPGDAEAAADAVRTLLADPAALEETAKAGRRRAEAKFGLDDARERLRRELDRLTAG